MENDMRDDVQIAIDLCRDIMFNGYDYTDLLEEFEAIRADERKRISEANSNSWDKISEVWEIGK